MLKCPKCFAENSGNRVSCFKCDTQLSYNEGYVCDYCQKEVGPFSESCRHCGMKLTSEVKTKQSNVVKFPKKNERSKRAKAKKVVAMKRKKPMQKRVKRKHDVKSIVILSILAVLAIIGIIGQFI